MTATVTPESSKGHWHDPPTRLVRAAPGADSARPGEPERRDARNITEISPENIENIAEEELSPAGPASPGEKYRPKTYHNENIDPKHTIKITNFKCVQDVGHGGFKFRFEFSASRFHFQCHASPTQVLACLWFVHKTT